MVFCKDQQWDHCIFLIYINGLPNSTINTNLNDNPKTILFADDTLVIINNPSFTDFLKKKKVINMVFSNVSEWFSSNLLSLNFVKTNFMHF
jgi:hypothetical protein